MNPIRVMSFNIQGESFPENGVNVWANRAALNARTILRAGPNLIGIQDFESLDSAMPHPLPAL